MAPHYAAYCSTGIIIPLVCPLVCLRGYKLQEVHSKDEGGMERRIMEKGISSPTLYSVSPTCRTKRKSFFNPHPQDFLPNVLSFSLVCLCLSLSNCHFPPKKNSHPPHHHHPSLFCCLFPSLCAVYFSLFTCSALRQILFHCCSHAGPIGNLLCTRTHTHTINTQTVQLQSWISHSHSHTTTSP